MPRGSGDPLKVQIRVDLDMPAPDGKPLKPSARLVDQAILHRIDSGQDAPFTKTRILEWQNPGRKRREDRAWRTGNQQDAWISLGPPLRLALLAEL